MKSESKHSKRARALTGVAVMVGAVGGVFGLASGVSAGPGEPDPKDIGHVWVFEICEDSGSYEGVEGILVRIAEKTSGVQYDSFDVVDPSPDTETYDPDPLWEAQGPNWRKAELFIPVSLDGEDPIYGDYQFLFDGPIKYDPGTGSEVVEELTLDLDCTDGGEDPPTWDFDGIVFNLPTPTPLPKTGSANNGLATLAPVLMVLGAAVLVIRRRVVTA